MSRRSVRIAVPDTLVFFPLFAADTMGLYAAQGLDVRFINLPGPKATDAMLAGEADLSATFAERPITMRREGKRVMNIMALLDENPVAFVARHDVPAGTVRDLAGRTIASTFPTAGSHMSLLAILRHAGLDPQKDVSISFVGVDGLLGALEERRAEAAIMPADFAYQAILQDRTARLLVDPRVDDAVPFLKHQNFTTLQGGSRALDTMKQEIEGVVRATVTAQARMREDADLALNLAASRFAHLRRPVLEAILRVDRPTYRARITAEAMRRVQDGLGEPGDPGSEPAWGYSDVVADEFSALWDSATR